MKVVLLYLLFCAIRTHYSECPWLSGALGDQGALKRWLESGKPPDPVLCAKGRLGRSLLQPVPGLPPATALVDSETQRTARQGS